jgi:hypothetical protein
MNMVKLDARIDENHRLSVMVPSSIPPGAVTVLILPESPEGDEADLWTAGVAHEWADELSDPRQDIYTLSDGEPVGEPG